MLKILTEAAEKIWKFLLGWSIAILLLPLLIPLFVYKQCVLVFAKAQGLVCIEPCVAFTVANKVVFGDEIEHHYMQKPLCNNGFYADLGEGNMDINELIQKIQTGLIDRKSATGYKLKSYLVRFGGYAFWKQNPDFKIEDHVHEVKLPAGEDIQDFLNIWITEPYTPKSSMWGVIVVKAESSEYLAIKVFHGLGDGFTVYEFANSIFETQTQPEALKRPSREIHFFDLVLAFIRAPAIFMEMSAKLKKVTDPFKITQGIEVKQFRSEKSFSVSKIKAIAKKQHVSFSAVLITVYAQAIRNYLASTNITALGSLVVLVPNPWPGRPKNFIGNHFTTMQSIVPLNTISPLDILCQVQANIEDYYSSGQSIVCKYLVMNLEGLLPLCCLDSDSGEWGKCLLSPILVDEKECIYNGRTARSASSLGGLLNPAFGICSITLSWKGQLNWMVVGAEDLFKTQENLKLLTHKYIAEELENLYEASITGSSSYLATFRSNP